MIRHADQVERVKTARARAVRRKAVAGVSNQCGTSALGEDSGVQANAMRVSLNSRRR